MVDHTVSFVTLLTAPEQTLAVARPKHDHILLCTSVPLQQPSACQAHATLLYGSHLTCAGTSLELGGLLYITQSMI